jgi:hypothetical protein
MHEGTVSKCTRVLSVNVLGYCAGVLGRRRSSAAGAGGDAGAGGGGGDEETPRPGMGPRDEEEDDRVERVVDQVKDQSLNPKP